MWKVHELSKSMDLMALVVRSSTNTTVQAIFTRYEAKTGAQLFFLALYHCFFHREVQA